MRVLVRTPDLRFPIWVPIPLGLAGAAVSIIPEQTLAEVRADLPQGVQPLLTKPMLKKLVKECAHVLKGYRGLEVVHVESADGTLVSIHL